MDASVVLFLLCSMGQVGRIIRSFQCGGMGEGATHV